MMKEVFFCVIIAMSSARGFRDKVCNLEPFVEGPCVEVMTLYSYFSPRNECVFWQGCLLNGNHFTNKTECEAKCKV
ncbi:BPTI/Kunitz domain-containing protein 4 [Drosophila biarmipes]|uniref:BPTI/Kunitz domain-containing protein 4 n=1 Tax=Drosophila biarmipes TaxID=125945 RepID=UPI0007E8715E|nr:BPTI/Kunitz domain-containing protein 4 [Drosophila biarmipes]